MADFVIVAHCHEFQRPYSNWKAWRAKAWIVDLKVLGWLLWTRSAIKRLSKGGGDQTWVPALQKMFFWSKWSSSQVQSERLHTAAEDSPKESRYGLNLGFILPQHKNTIRSVTYWIIKFWMGLWVRLWGRPTQKEIHSQKREVNRGEQSDKTTTITPPSSSEHAHHE